MKRILSIQLFICMTAALYAQIPGADDVAGYMNDCYTWGSDFTYGSARITGMGGAFTAVGGDIGAVAINPASAVVAPYSQVSLTMGAGISMVASKGRPTASGITYLDDSYNTTNTQFIVPNGGFSFNFDTGNYKGLKRFSFGFNANTRNLFNFSLRSGGTAENTSSYAGYLADNASRIPKDNWTSFTRMAYDTDIINWHEALPEGKYMGITEWPCEDGSVVTDNYLKQNYNFKTTGNKTDYIFNVGFNISDIFFVGADLGMQSLSYFEDDSFTETAAPDCDFNTGFKNLGHSHSYRCSGFGIYGKFGFIVIPVPGLRIGAAIQTPTILNVSEAYSHTLYNAYGTKTLNRTEDNNNIRYNLKEPFRFNVGIACTISKKAILSVDYEFCDYSQTMYQARYASDVAWFQPVNDQIAGKGQYNVGSLGISNFVRAGVEVKPIEEFAFRVGYNYISDGSRFPGSGNGDYHCGFFGVGYDSPGSFFCDLAASMNFRPERTFNPYFDYTNRAPEGAELLTSCGPVVGATSRLLNIVFTAGWRF